jgi:SNF2 family DNA or RNA helicase
VGQWWDKLDPEQVEAAEFVIELDGTAALFSEQGTGKTIIALAVLEVIRPKTVVIVTPLTSVDATWAARLRATFPDYRIVHTIEDFRIARRAQNRVMLVCHYEYLARRIPRFLRLDWDMAIFDESQALKARGSGWSRAAKRIRRKAKRRLILSGTPIDKSPIDVWAQMRFIDPEVFGDRWGGTWHGKGKRGFVDEWCTRGGFMNKKVIFRDELLPRFLKKLRPYAFRLSIDYLKLPPCIIHLIPVRMYGDQRRIYDQFSKRSSVTIDGEMIKAELAISENIIKQQITGGYIKVDGDVLHVGNAKQRKLSWLLKHVDLPVVTFCKFLGEMDGIEERMLGEMKVVRRLYGKVKDNRKTGDMRRTKLLSDFQAGKIDGLICQRKTGGVSVEFTRAADVILYSVGYSLIDFEQIISRLRRRGQDRQVNVYVLYVIDSIDEDILDVIDEKRSTAWKVNRYLERNSTEDRQHGKGREGRQGQRRQGEREEHEGRQEGHRVPHRSHREVRGRSARGAYGHRAGHRTREVA